MHSTITDVPIEMKVNDIETRGVTWGDGTEETTGAGELFFWPGGHTGWTDEGVTFLEFSPADDIRPVLEHLASQMAT